MSDSSLLQCLRNGDMLTDDQYTRLLHLQSPASIPDPDAANVTLSLEQRIALDQLSKDTNEPVEVCIRVWRVVSDATSRRRLEKTSGRVLGSLEGDLASAAKVLMQQGSLL